MPLKAHPSPDRTRTVAAPNDRSQSYNRLFALYQQEPEVDDGEDTPRIDTRLSNTPAALSGDEIRVLLDSATRSLSPPRPHKGFWRRLRS
ncbi:hypothetical protein GGQ68_001515 [Sagittula marina]|uniref:Uncharacterized protein n=1 Tax=Sagittula marina TaxID=943940 RepID=A0A7W6GRA5_9RHOB|nr:hypothetical protein [Sagittula marina]